MEIEIKELRIKLPKWKWWQYLLFFAGIILLLKGDYQTLYSWLKLILS